MYTVTWPPHNHDTEYLNYSPNVLLLLFVHLLPSTLRPWQALICISCCRLEFPLLRFHTNGTIRYFVFLALLLSLSLMVWRFICVVACTASSFIVLHSIPPSKQSPFVIRSSVGGCSWIVSVGCEAAENVPVPVSVWTHVAFLWGNHGRFGLPGRLEGVFHFVRNCRTLSRRGCAVWHSRQDCSYFTSFLVFGIVRFLSHFILFLFLILALLIGI